MGLSERKTKQKIGADPRNLTWANDNSRFGQQYLEKFGWTVGSGSGLGVSGQGRLSHISVAQKLNLLGIGGNNNNNNNNNNGDVSWKQTRDYELMLKRLNTTTTGGEEGDEDESRRGVSSMVPDGFGFVRAGESMVVVDEKTATNVSVGEVDGDERDRKRLRKERKRKEKATAKAKAKAKASVEKSAAPSCSSAITDADADATLTLPSPQPPPVPPPVPPPPSLTKPPRRLAHRAKFRASKQLASSDAAALTQILGIGISHQSAVPSEGAPSQAQSAVGTPAGYSPSPVVPVVPTPAATDKDDQQIRTSTTSVADYFAAKMRARQQVAVTATTSPVLLQPAEHVPTPTPVPVPVPVPVPESDSEAQDAPAGTTPVDGTVARKDKDKKQKRKRKRKDAGDEKLEMHGDRTELHADVDADADAESKKRKKKKRKME